MEKPCIRGRLAPSPSGSLHLGNIWSFLIGWLAVRSQKGEILLRVDDIDPQRSKKYYENSIISDLRWLGLNWDGEEFRQSKRLAYYTEAINELDKKSMLYPCFCSRKELRMLASAPHPEDWEVEYPGTCLGLSTIKRSQLIKQGQNYSVRFHCNQGSVTFQDIVYGKQNFERASWGGDFAIRRSDGVFSYQLASVVDDALMGINLVVRGRDLLSSTPRQILLMHSLGYDIPEFAHVPMLLNMKQERLAKRHKSLSISELRQTGVKAAEITGLLSKLCGLNPTGEAVMPAELVPHFAWDAIPESDQIINESNLYI